MNNKLDFHPQKNRNISDRYDQNPTPGAGPKQRPATNSGAL